MWLFLGSFRLFALRSVIFWFIFPFYFVPVHVRTGERRVGCKHDYAQYCTGARCLGARVYRCTPKTYACNGRLFSLVVFSVVFFIIFTLNFYSIFCYFSLIYCISGAPSLFFFYSYDQNGLIFPLFFGVFTPFFLVGVYWGFPAPFFSPFRYSSCA